MERQERALGDRTDEHEQHRGDGQRVVERGRFAHDRGQRRGAGLGDDDDNADEHRQATKCRDQEGLQRGTARFAPPSEMTNEEIGKDGRRFPENEHDDDVVADHEPKHHAGETQEKRGEASKALRHVGEVPRAVNEHECADH